MDSLWLFWSASDIVLKGVALMLLGMSVWSWSIMILKLINMISLKKYVNQAYERQQYGSTTDLLESSDNPFFIIKQRALKALQAYEQIQVPVIAINEWLSEALRGGIDQANQAQQFGMSALASITSTAPFIGLLGTVWAIYHALSRISNVGQVTIAQLAGPVGDALIMTAMGLAVAIPSALAYNGFVRLNRYYSDAFNHFSRLVFFELLSKRDSAYSDNHGDI